MKPVTVYHGQTNKRLAYLQNAHNVKYQQFTTALWTASFCLPSSDVKNKYCAAFNLVELWDVDEGGDDRYVGLFRIMPSVAEDITSTAVIQYTLEHVLGTLLDDVMIGWHEIGNLDAPTSMCIAYVLNQQITTRWMLEQCDYSHEYLYGWQDENLLSALYSIVAPFTETDYYWDFDTKVFPWRLRLKQTSKIPKTDIRHKKNLLGITKTVDPSNLVTRLYCYGSGEGDNKLTIANVNNGLPYLDSPNISKYGVLSTIWTDEKITVEESLLTVGTAMLKKLEEPTVSYDLDIQTVKKAADLQIGDVVRMVHDTLDENMVVIKLTKDNLSGAPNTGKIVLGSGTTDITSSVADLAERQRISETYSQGAESIFTDSFYDNADVENPSEIRFSIPQNAIHVNEIAFSVKLTEFRAYSRATQGGGANSVTTQDGGSINTTSSEGGEAQTTSLGGGDFAQTSGSSGGGITTSLGGGSDVISSKTGGQSSSTETYDIGSGYGNAVWGDAWSLNGVTSTVDDHSHKVHVHQHPHKHKFELPGHTHEIDLPQHTHNVVINNHTHSIILPTHTHSVLIPNHTHKVFVESHSHSVSLPNHVHQIEYGIYKGPKATKMTILLDDKEIGVYEGSVTDLNLIEHMTKNANGNILRGDHTITIIPDSLTRIEAMFLIRLFTNNRGGGQY